MGPQSVGAISVIKSHPNGKVRELDKISEGCSEQTVMRSNSRGSACLFQYLSGFFFFLFFFQCASQLKAPLSDEIKLLIISFHKDS